LQKNIYEINKNSCYLLGHTRKECLETKTNLFVVAAVAAAVSTASLLLLLAWQFEHSSFRIFALLNRGRHLLEEFGGDRRLIHHLFDVRLPLGL